MFFASSSVKWTSVKVLLPLSLLLLFTSAKAKVMQPDLTPEWLWWQSSNCSFLLIYSSQKDERLSWPGWLTYSRRFTHISIRSMMCWHVSRCEVVVVVEEVRFLGIWEWSDSHCDCAVHGCSCCNRRSMLCWHVRKRWQSLWSCCCCRRSMTYWHVRTMHQSLWSCCCRRSTTSWHVRMRHQSLWSCCCCRRSTTSWHVRMRCQSLWSCCCCCCTRSTVSWYVRTRHQSLLSCCCCCLRRSTTSWHVRMRGQSLWSCCCCCRRRSTTSWYEASVVVKLLL